MTASTPGAPLSVAASSLQPPPLSRAPYLAVLCAVSGLAAWLLDAIAIPSFAQNGDPTTWAWLARGADFLSLVSALSGLIAVPLAIVSPLHASLALKLGKPLPLSGFGAGLLYVVARAAFFEHQETASQQVFLAIGAAHMLGISLAMSTLRLARDRLLQIALVGVMVMSACGLAGQVLDILVRIQLTMLRVRLGQTAAVLGQLGFLVAVLAVSLRLFLTAAARREQRLNWALLGVTLISSFLLARHLGEDFPVVLYHAQRVHLLLELAPFVHTLPICFALAGGIAGLLNSAAGKRQLALCALLFVSAGYNPHAPGRLLLLSLGMLLLARYTITLGETAAIETSAD